MLLPFFSPGSPPLPLSPEARGGERRAAAPLRVVRQCERALMALLPHPHAGGSHPEGLAPVAYKKMNPFCVPFATTNMGSAILAMDLVPYMINDLSLLFHFYTRLLIL